VRSFQGWRAKPGASSPMGMGLSDCANKRPHLA
jgi:hypothetical protein